MSDAFSLNIRALPVSGYVVTEQGEEVAAFSSASEVAQWIETRLRSLPAEQARLADDGHPISMPNVVRAEERRFWPRRQS